MFKDLIGVPYQKLNCWSLVKEGFKKYGIVVPDYSIACEAVALVSYETKATWEIIWKQRKKWERLDEPKIPCLIAISLNHPKIFHHLGLYIDNNKMLHTTRYKNSCIERLDRPYFKNREKGFWKYVG